MTSPVSAPCRLSEARWRRGFTLTELLVVIGIIALLITITAAALLHAQKTANATRIKADMAAIASALEQYHTDLGVYPMSSPRNGQMDWTHVLAKALVSPEAANIDGKDGFGFKARVGGRDYPAYLNTDSYRTRLINNQLELLDHMGNPIAYYPRRFKSAGNGRIPLLTGSANPADPNFKAYYNLNDGPYDPTANADVRQGAGAALAWALGHRPDNGGFPAMVYTLGPGETQTFDGPFILVSPGLDDRFSVLPVSGKTNRQAMNENDDVYSFDWK